MTFCSAKILTDTISKWHTQKKQKISKRSFRYKICLLKTDTKKLSNLTSMDSSKSNYWTTREKTKTIFRKKKRRNVSPLMYKFSSILVSSMHIEFCRSLKKRISFNAKKKNWNILMSERDLAIEAKVSKVIATINCFSSDKSWKCVCVCVCVEEALNRWRWNISIYIYKHFSWCWRLRQFYLLWFRRHHHHRRNLCRMQLSFLFIFFSLTPFLALIYSFIFVYTVIKAIFVWYHPYKRELFYFRSH